VRAHGRRDADDSDDPPLEGLDYVEAWTSREVYVMAEPPRDAVVLGGGPVGVETAQMLRRHGSDVTIVAEDGRLLSREDNALPAGSRGRPAGLCETGGHPITPCVYALESGAVRLSNHGRIDARWGAAPPSRRRPLGRAGLRPSGVGHHLAMTSNGDAHVDRSPYDGQGRVDIDGYPGWKYLPFESNSEGGGPVTVTAEGPEVSRSRFRFPPT
jgi:hypothetical protein